ncbi:MAG TPA: cytochrome c [Phnomibacter sp.]|nr:cytochrome c [Phnomibacter sp.]
MKAILLTILMLGFSIAAFVQTTKPANYEAGRKVYTQLCMSCHQKDGKGIIGLNPTLVKTEWVLGDKKRLINIVLKGQSEPLTIDGEEYVIPMPPQPQLTDVQIADVLTYIRNSFGNKASVVKTTEVKAARAALPH